jgi:hypothetical protein
MFGVGNAVSDEHIKAVGISAVRFARKSEFVTRTIAGEKEGICSFVTRKVQPLRGRRSW